MAAITNDTRNFKIFLGQGGWNLALPRRFPSACECDVIFAADGNGDGNLFLNTSR